jgi:hypothetical protein
MAPTRPVSGASIAVDWGDEVHDRTFAPKGTRCNSVTARTVGTPSIKQNLDAALDDPGSWLDVANDQLEVPSGADGLYIGYVAVDSVNGDAGTSTRVSVLLNGTSTWSGTTPNEGGSHVLVTVPIGGNLTAGDIITVFANRLGSGTNMSVVVDEVFLVRQGDELGA